MTLPRPACVILDNANAVRHLRDELARLAERSGAASSIVQHPDWLLFELESRDGAATPYVVVASGDNGKPIGYAPFVVEYHHARIAVGDRRVPIYQGRALRLLGAGVVSSPQDRPAAEAAIAEALKRDRSIHVLRIRETELPNTLANAVSTGSAHFTTVQANLLDQINWTIEPQESLHAYLASLGSKRRNDLTRRLRNVYKKLGETAQLRIVDTPEQIDDYCALMNQVYARSWHAEAVAIDWTLPTRRALFRQLASEHRLIGHLLMLGDQPIAYVHGYRLGGRYLLDDTGYDEAFAVHGVGSALVFQAVQDLLERYPGEVIDFGYGDNQYKRVLANRQVPCGALYMVRGVGARLRFGMIAPLRWTYRGVRRVMRRD